MGTDPQETLQACRQFKLISVVYQRNKPFLLRTMSFWYICYSVHILEYLIKNTNTKSLKEAEKGNTFLLLHIEQLLLHLVHFPFSLLHHSPSHIYLRFLITCLLLRACAWNYLYVSLCYTISQIKYDFELMYLLA